MGIEKKKYSFQADASRPGYGGASHAHTGSEQPDCNYIQWNFNQNQFGGDISSSSTLNHSEGQLRQATAQHTCRDPSKDGGTILGEVCPEPRVKDLRGKCHHR